MDEWMVDAFLVWWVYHYTHVVDKNVRPDRGQSLTLPPCWQRCSSIGHWHQDILVLPLSPELPQWRSSQIPQFRWERPVQKKTSRERRITRSEAQSISSYLLGTTSAPGAGKPTAHLLPQFSWPPQPQQSSCSSPMKTNAGRSICLENTQVKVIVFPPVHRVSQAQHLLVKYFSFWHCWMSLG